MVCSRVLGKIPVMAWTPRSRIFDRFSLPQIRHRVIGLAITPLPCCKHRLAPVRQGLKIFRDLAFGKEPVEGQLGWDSCGVYGLLAGAFALKSFPQATNSKPWMWRETFLGEDAAYGSVRKLLGRVKIFREPSPIQMICAFRTVMLADSHLPKGPGAEFVSDKFQDYWNKNIDKWGEKYLEISHGHEVFDRPAWFTSLYNATIGRLERRLMKERYRRTIAFLDEHVGPGTAFSDLGCGTGIFVVEAAKRGARVINAIDFSESSLAITRRRVEEHVPGADVRFIQADLQTADLPEVDVTLAMGVTPYLADVDAFIANALPKTKIMCCQFTDSSHWASRIRRAIPALDVRSLQCYEPEYIRAQYARHNGIILERKRFASGYIDIVAINR